MEVWKSVPDYPEYQVSSFGNVKRLYNKYHNAEEHLLKPGRMGGNSGDGDYYFVRLSKENKVKNFYIHRLVGLTFLPNPDNLPQIDHINQNKLDNNVTNLRWVSRSQNHLNKSHKLSASGERHIEKDKRCESYCFRISRRIEGKSRDIVHQTYKTLPEAIEARNKYLAENKI